MLFPCVVLAPEETETQDRRSTITDSPTRTELLRTVAPEYIYISHFIYIVAI